MKVLIVDDEPLARARVRGLLAAMPEVAWVGEAEGGMAALHACDRHQPDVLLLDIHMPDISGMEVARQLSLLPKPPLLVFCTAYDDHAVSAFDVAALDYLVKPLRAERLAQALQRARERLGERVGTDAAAVPAQRTQLCVKVGGQLRLIPIVDIRYLHAEEKYVVVHHANGEDLVDESLKSLEEEFGERFLRIHRSCLIARDALKALRRTPEGHAQVLLHGVDKPLDVSRRCLADVKEAMRSWV